MKQILDIGLLLIFIIFSLGLKAQNVIIKGKVARAADSLAIENALIRYGNESVFSDSLGAFTITVSGGKTKLEIGHPGFQRIAISVNEFEKTGQIFLVPKGLLKEVEVATKKVNGFRGVVDFTIVNNRLLVSIFKGGKQWFELHELSTGFPKVAVLRDNLKTNELTTDCLGRIFAVNDENAYPLSIANDTIILGNPVKVKVFNVFKNACLIADTNYQLYKDFHFNNKGLAIIAVDVKSDSEKLITYSLDTNGYIFTKTLSEEIGYIESAQFENASKNARVQQYKARSQELFDLYALLRTVSLGGNYLPAFRIQNNWWLFNHFGNIGLILSTDSLIKKEEFVINYQHNPEWYKQIIQADDEELYLRFQQKNGSTYLQHFDITGRKILGPSILLKQNFPQKIGVSKVSVIYKAKNPEGYYNLYVEPITKL